MRTNYLPLKITSKDDDDDVAIKELSYTFTTDGYVETCTIKETEVYGGNTDIDTTIYTFKWQ